jgi:hypothetical protein
MTHPDSHLRFLELAAIWSIQSLYSTIVPLIYTEGLREYDGTDYLILIKVLREQRF